mgnify:CR=1 FL=1
MDIVLINNQIEMSWKTETTVIKDLMTLCKIKHYHIINDDKILDYKDRKFIDGNGNRVYFDTTENVFKESRYFWNNSPTTYKSKIVCLDYKPSKHKLNSLLIMLNSYNNLSDLNYIPYEDRIEVNND